MRKIFLSFFFLISTIVFAGPASVTILAYDQPTEYIHAYQDMCVVVQDPSFINSSIVTIDIGNIITITSNASEGKAGIVNGSNQLLLTPNMSSSITDMAWTLWLVAKGDVSFIQKSKYTITIY